MFSEFVQATTALKAATEIAKGVTGARDKMKDATVKLQMVELMECLADARSGIVEMRNMVLDRDERIAELEAAMRFRTEAEWDGAVYWRKLNDRAVAFCPQCADSDSRQVRLRDDGPSFQCPTCKNYFRRTRAPF